MRSRRDGSLDVHGSAGARVITGRVSTWGHAGSGRMPETHRAIPPDPGREAFLEVTALFARHFSPPGHCLVEEARHPHRAAPGEQGPAFPLRGRPSTFLAKRRSFALRDSFSVGQAWRRAVRKSFPEETRS